MKRLSTSLTAMALGSALAISCVVPAGAMSMPVPQQQQVKQSTDVEVVRAKIKRYHRGARTPKARHNRNYNKRSAWHGQNRSNWRGHQARNYRYWHGHRGYNYYRPGYRRYDGFWFPAAAFTTGVVIGTTVTRGNAHVRWCSNQYVSYRVSDNTFQPYDGPRRQCVSP